MIRALRSRSFLAGLAIVLLPLVASERVGRSLAMCNEAFGCNGVVFFAGAIAGIVAGVVVTDWSGLLDLAVGMWLGGALWGAVVAAAAAMTDPAEILGTVLVTVPFGSATFLGFLGLPLFLIVAVFRWVGRRQGGSGPPPAA